MEDNCIWKEGLCQEGLYYEGWVEDLSSVLESHSKATVTCYGTRRSSKTPAACMLRRLLQERGLQVFHQNCMISCNKKLITEIVAFGISEIQQVCKHL